MLPTLGLVGVFLLVVLLIVGIALFVWGVKHAVLLAINSVIGFFALYAIQAFIWPDLVINWISVIIVAIGGIFGFGLVLILHFFGLWF